MIVYLIRNKENGRLYVGKTVVPLVERWYHHVWRAKNRPQVNCLLHRAIRLHGAQNFEISELARASSPEELNQLEKHFIRILNTFPPENGVGYNLTPGGDGKAKGSKWAPGQREKFIASMKGKLAGRKNPRCAKFGAANPMFGRKTSEETKEKIRVAVRATCLGENNPFFGRKHTPEYRAMMSRRMSGSGNPAFGKNGSENSKKSWITRKRRVP